MTKLITMLTENDETSHDALRLFENCAELPCQFWGFKDIGLPRVEMARLVQRMRECGKTTFLEVVSLSEQECMEGAKLAVECEFDYLMGTLYYPSVHRFLAGKKLKFFPFCGRVTGHPSIVEGTIEEVVEDAQGLEGKKVDGLDLLAYRFKGDAVELARRLLRSVGLPVVVAGSIDTCDRLDLMKQLDPWAFTIGSAFFAKKFVRGGDFKAQLAYVLEYLAK